ncbi:unnamed protein product [Vitrella brassicaformis CCMP3155]|uniref:CHORD domain-containing protein n=2 Tax=Vitrella brassicaformis TaxID=1169539 RepID=A0A0G4F0P0_VITBC|nr:unnamed protein product [Vitrella brassicaformis CCMP3155]|mmetsp:Transcript_20357/g.58134  ORF Transcript_20357/g.58134 Transcript_20357/m.58134 type:complete len:208 (+) Transcript_20357:191-814(+)|eukprot:CEM04625.1 unnamed protein product [Vitrella brassicaformis CCMP3155]
MTEGSSLLKRCRRHGCHAEYREEENHDQACCYHPGWPVFHDLKKSWTCCNASSYDWDDFMKIPGCARGFHTTEKPQRPEPPKPAARAPVAAAPSPQPVKDINEYNRQQANEKKQAAAANAASAPDRPMKPMVTKSGRYKCCNGGCNQEYEPDENHDTACRYHPGKPIFHDLKKYWSCCSNIVKYDWDEFMQIEPCAIGRHNPKMVPA